MIAIIFWCFLGIPGNQQVFLEWTFICRGMRSSEAHHMLSSMSDIKALRLVVVVRLTNLSHMPVISTPNHDIILPFSHYRNVHNSQRKCTHVPWQNIVMSFNYFWGNCVLTLPDLWINQSSNLLLSWLIQKYYNIWIQPFTSFLTTQPQGTVSNISENG